MNTTEKTITIITIDYAGTYGLIIPSNLKCYSNYFENENENFTQEIKLWAANDAQLDPQVHQIIQANLENLENTLNNDPGDDDYFDYIPATIDQILQLITMVFTTPGTYFKRYPETQKYFQEIIDKYNSMDPEDGINHIDLDNFEITEGYDILFG